MIDDGSAALAADWEGHFFEDTYDEAFRAGYEQALRDGIAAIRREHLSEDTSPNDEEYEKALAHVETAIWGLLYNE
ncbi:MAG: hypothetical protein JSV66_15790 [Trueperaceae bacterium]|nr:MAG: hypothetical protein JSV66_15790 [Trueperaceae bacterium]